jgi:hypothetical protein
LTSSKSIVSGNENSEDAQEVFRESLNGTLFITFGFAVNQDPASSLFADEFQEFKTKSSQSVVVQDNNFFGFFWINLIQKG